MEIEQLKKVRKQMLDDWLKSCPFVFVDKTNPYGNDEHLTKIIFNLSKLKQYCNKIATMQEGPNWYWQDYTLQQQIWYYNTIQEADFMFVHNESDKKYYEGLTGKECKVLPSLMIEDSVRDLPQIKRKDIIIGGNFCSWYGGFDSYIVAQKFNTEIFAPSMGRKIENEEQMENLTHLPYMNWLSWVNNLSKFKYGVHLMTTHAAGTFALNCAYHGIPCIGYRGLDTQQELHPLLSVDDGDLNKAVNLAQRLKEPNHYNQYSISCRENYKNSLYNEENFVPYITEILESLNG